LLGNAAFAADHNPAASAELALSPPDSQLPEARHKFLDRHNKLSLVIFGGLLAADGVTTQQNLGHNAHELNPVAKPLVDRGWAGQLAASALGGGSVLGLAYLFHQTGHRKLERFVLHFAIGAEAAMVSNNLARAQTP
jgi:hypothetical protein